MGKLLHLQGVRGVAISSVILFHFYPSFFPNGYIGVDMFFILSGYLMSMMLSRNSANLSSIFEFIYRRFKRILPLYYLIQLLAIGLTSVAFYLAVDEVTAFNNVFCRMWQFLLGNIVFLLEEPREALLSEKLALIEEDRPRLKALNTLFMLCWSFLLVLLYSLCCQEKLSVNFLRLSSTVITALLIHFGANFTILENYFLVFIGEISYSWYLLHWPMLMLQRIYDFTSEIDIFWGLILSLLVSIVIHFYIEKPLLNVNSKTLIIFFVSTMAISCYFTRRIIIENRADGCSVLPRVITDYSNLTDEEIANYNLQLIDADGKQLYDKRCTPPSFSFSDTLLKAPICQYTNTSGTNNKTLLIIGNSWAANSAPIVFEECRESIKNIFRLSSFGCEVLYVADNDYCKKAGEDFLSAVKEINPDFLFIIARYMVSAAQIKDWDASVEEMKKRIGLLSGFVKEKIFILHTFPETKINRRLLLKKQHFDFKNPNIWMETTQLKLKEVIESCEKCEEFDYTPSFIFNGKFSPYDPINFVTYLTLEYHFTLAGLERIRPVYSQICRKL